MTFWLLQDSVLSVLAKARASQKIDMTAMSELDARASSSVPATVSSREATIKVKGVMTDTPDFFAMFFGGGNATYPQIVTALAAANADENVDQIRLVMDTPGGTTDGLMSFMTAIKNSSKPVHVHAVNKLASAGYIAASQATKITADDESTRVGSVGVVADIRVRTDSVSITSSDAPNKRPDVTTDEGKKVVQAELDAIADVFLSATADGRDTTLKKVKSDYGKGGMLMADEALSRGMIDAVGVNSKTAGSSDGKTTKSEATPMDLNTFKAQHPAVYAQAFAEGKTVGIEDERGRTLAHLTAAKSSGMYAEAVAAVESGKNITQAEIVAHTMAAVNKSATQARLDDEADSGAGDLANASEQDDDTAKLEAAVLSSMGVEA